MKTMVKSRAALPADFDCSARRDWRYWLCLCFGLAVFGAGLALSRPEAGGQLDGFPSFAATLMQFVGGLFVILGLLALWRNANRGSRFDPATGELHWWHSRTSLDPGVSGFIHPADIKRIILIKQDSREDETILIGPDDRTVPGFGSNVIHWRSDVWAKQLVNAYPHIKVEER
jgi:hypothetical protein